MKIKIYYYCYLYGRYKTIIPEQISILEKSQILKEKNHEINFIVCGDDLSWFNRLGVKYTYIGNINRFEFPPLKILQEEAHSNLFDYCCYFHTKCTSKTDFSPNCHKDSSPIFCDKWRKTLMKEIILNWRDVIKKLTTHDLVAWQFSRTLGYPEKIWKGECYSHGLPVGNFYWASKEYILSLKDINNLDWTNRGAAHFWIGCSNRNLKLWEIYRNKSFFITPKSPAMKYNYV